MLLREICAVYTQPATGNLCVRGWLLFLCPLSFISTLKEERGERQPLKLIIIVLSNYTRLVLTRFQELRDNWASQTEIRYFLYSAPMQLQRGLIEEASQPTHSQGHSLFLSPLTMELQLSHCGELLEARDKATDFNNAVKE